MAAVILTVIILNYRTPQLTLDCVLSLVPQRKDVSFNVIVVDNDSQDGSADRISKGIISYGWSDWVTLVRSPKNLGFAAGNNFGLTFIPSCDFVLLLNSDTIVGVGCLNRCISVLQSDRSVGALSCKLLNQDGSIQNTTRKFPTPSRAICTSLGLPFRFPRWFEWADIQDMGWDRSTVSREVDWLGGAFLMVPKTVLDQIGGLDEDFFFYGEDVEFCFRIWKAGYRCWYESSVSTTHLGGGSSDVTRLPSERQSKHRWDARYLEQRKLNGRWSEYLVWTVDIIVGAKRKLQNWIRS